MVDYEDKTIDDILLSLPATEDQIVILAESYIEELSRWEVGISPDDAKPYKVIREDDPPVICGYETEEQMLEAYQKFSSRAAAVAYFQAYLNLPV